MFQPGQLDVSRDGLRIDIALLLRRMILDGVLAPDRQLVVEELAAEMGVSQRPVREALIVLDAEGYVNVAARRGTYVLRITEDDVADRVEALALVAGMAASRSVAGPDGLGETRLESPVRRAIGGPGSDATWGEVLTALGKSSGSERIAKELNALVVALAGRVRPKGDPGEPPGVLLEAVLNAIASGDADTAGSTAERLFRTCDTDLRGAA